MEKFRIEEFKEECEIEFIASEFNNKFMIKEFKVKEFEVKGIRRKT